MRRLGPARPGDLDRPGELSAQDREFSDYAAGALSKLRDTAYLMCHDWHLADDLAQQALTKLYLAWPRVSRADNIDAYARKVLVRGLLDHRRRRSSGETPTLHLPDRAEASTPDLRLALIDALSNLKPLDRAIVVLRYWEDYTVEQVASLLEIGDAAVRMRSMRAMAKLRAVLADESSDFLS